jgi:hypothetical protein
MKKTDLERTVTELKAEIERLREENSRLRHGKATFRDGRDEYVAVSKIDWTRHPEANAICEIPPRLLCEGKCLASEYGPDDRLLSARYQLIYHDYDERIDPAARYYLIDYSYDYYDGTDINAVWLLEKVG